MSEAKRPDDVDRFVGQQIREARRSKRMTQEQVGKALGLTFQQVQKYEKGVNRVSAGRLLRFSELFECPVEYFFPVSSELSSDKDASDPEAEVAELQEKIKSQITQIKDIDDLRAIKRLMRLAIA